MKGITFQGKGNVLLQSVKEPKIIEPTDVIIKIRLAGLCGSDLHIYHARETTDIGTVMGHELVGEICETGRAVKSFNTGDLVYSPFTTSCGQCFFCLNGLSCRCSSGQLLGWRDHGIGLQGGQAEYVRVPLADSTLRRVRAGLSEVECLLLGDNFPTGYYCAQMAEIGPVGTYVVLGCGPVGLLAIQSAIQLLGANHVYAIDNVPFRLSIAKSYGAIPLNFDQLNPVEYIIDITKGIGADAVMEVVGNAHAGKMAFQMVRPGGTISTVGVHTENSFSFSPVEAYNKNLTYKIGRCPARSLVEKLEDRLIDGNLDITKVITHTFSLEDVKKAYQLFDKKEDNCLKAIFRI